MCQNAGPVFVKYFYNGTCSLQNLSNILKPLCCVQLEHPLFVLFKRLNTKLDCKRMFFGITNICRELFDESIQLVPACFHHMNVLYSKETYLTVLVVVWILMTCSQKVFIAQNVCIGSRVNNGVFRRVLGTFPEDLNQKLVLWIPRSLHSYFWLRRS